MRTEWDKEKRGQRKPSPPKPPSPFLHLSVLGRDVGKPPWLRICRTSSAPGAEFQKRSQCLKSPILRLSALVGMGKICAKPESGMPDMFSFPLEGPRNLPAILCLHWGQSLLNVGRVCLLATRVSPCCLYLFSEGRSGSGPLGALHWDPCWSRPDQPDR